MAKQVEDVVTDDRVESLKTVMNLRKSTIKK